MTQLPLSRRARRHLLAGIPALLLVLPAAAHAQARDVSAEGRTVVTNNQRSDGATVQGVIADPPVSLGAATLSDAEARIAGNAIVAEARVNDASASIASDAVPVDAWPARLTIIGDTVTAEAGALALGRQSLRRSSAIAVAPNSGYALGVGEARRSHVALEDNAQAASAHGNDHVATLSDIAGGGAAVVAVQRGDAASAVLAGLGGITSLSADTIEAGTFQLDDNRQQAAAIGNDADLSLDAAGPTQQSSNEGDATVVESGRDTAVHAGSAIVASQYWSGPATARIGSIGEAGGYLAVGESLAGSSLSADGDAVGAAAIANQAVSRLRSDAPVALGRGNIATSLTVQDAGGIVSANVIGGARSHALGPVDHSMVSVSDDAVGARANGNVSDTLLIGHAGAVAASSEGGASRAGSAWVDPDSHSGTTGSFAVHTEQHAGDTAIAASLARSGTDIGLDGDVVASHIVSSGNRQSAEAVANDARSMLDLRATDMTGSAVTSLVQSSDADASANAGSGDDLAGATIAPELGLHDTRLEIRDNLVSANTLANRGANALSVSAASMDRMGQPVPQAGGADGGAGVSAAAALSSVQKTGKFDLVPAIFSEIVGRFSVTGDGPTDGTVIEIDGNRQHAGATANAIDNSLVASGGMGSALFSSQYGAASVRAVSTMRAVSRGGLVDSAARIDGNVNQAVATVNDAVNRLEVDAAGSERGGRATLAADALGGATGVADGVLVNAQFAEGGVVASATTLLGGSAGDGSMGTIGPQASRLEVSDNIAAAQASGNQARNQAELESDGGIASSQMNIASVGAAATSTTVLGDGLSGRSILASDLSVSGNTSSALARGNVAENVVTGTSGPSDLAAVNGDRFEAHAEAPVSLVSFQTNYGAVSASLQGSVAAIPLNAGGVPVDASQIRLTGNAMSASAYGNGVANTVTPGTGRVAGVALVNAQINYGPVVARVTGPGAVMASGDTVRSTLSIANNSISASATGNLATNIVGIPR